MAPGPLDHMTVTLIHARPARKTQLAPSDQSRRRGASSHKSPCRTIKHDRIRVNARTKSEEGANA